MTDHDALLLKLGAPNGAVHGPVIVCQGHHEQPDETPARWSAARKLDPRPLMAEGATTGAEARWIVAHAGDEVTVLTHGYHVPRVFLTLVQDLLDAEREYQLRVWVVGIPGREDKWPAEQRKIVEYQQLGYLATYGQALEYLRWRDQ